MNMWLLLIATWWFLMATRPAAAYLDPGTGGMLLQLLLAGLAGLAIWLKMNWRRFTQKLGLRKTDAEADDKREPTPPDPPEGPTVP